MTQKTTPMDLCSNCVNITHCVYCKNKKETVHFCEEFACKTSGTDRKEIERMKRADTLFLPESRPGLFDDCGRSVPQDN